MACVAKGKRGDMAVSSMVISSTSQLDKSYRAWTLGSGRSDAEKKVVIDGTVAILRRHSINGTICSNCSNNDLNSCQVTKVDDLDFITEVQCLECGQYLSTACRRSRYYYERIRDPSVLVRGDHIGWYRPLAYWHHAIVVGQYPDRVAVVESDIPKGMAYNRMALKEYPHRSVSSVLYGSLYRISHDDCYTDEYTALRAERMIGQEKYDFFEQNCEHSINWCKTGRLRSDQIESLFISAGRIVLTMSLRALLLGVVAFMQICQLTGNQSARAGELTLERRINIGYISVVVAIFVIHSVYKGCGKMKVTRKPLTFVSEDDRMESWRKNCTDETYRRCCNSNPHCGRVTCFVCCIGCICCSVGDACCSLCARKLRICCTLCCGRPVPETLGLLIRILIREMIAASGPFLCIWFKADIAGHFEEKGVFLVDNVAINQALIVFGAIIVARIASYTVGVLLSRLIEGLYECCCCLCNHSPGTGKYKHDKCLQQPCPVHDEVVHISNRNIEYRVTNVPIEQLNDNRSAVILL